MNIDQHANEILQAVLDEDGEKWVRLMNEAISEPSFDRDLILALSIMSLNTTETFLDAYGEIKARFVTDVISKAPPRLALDREQQIKQWTQNLPNGPAVRDLMEKCLGERAEAKGWKRKEAQ